MPKKVQKSQKFVTRSLAFRAIFSSLIPDERTLTVVCTTQDAVEVWDWDSWGVIKESLLMSGASWPASGQIPLLDSHMNQSVAHQLGSARNLRVEGDQLVAEVVFSTTPAADEAFTKVCEGHLTDYSIGYQIISYEMLKDNETKTYDQLTLTGPCRVSTAWRVNELSICPIGADPAAKGRAKENKMSQKKKKKLQKNAPAPTRRQPVTRSSEEEQSALLAEIAELQLQVDELLNQEGSEEEVAALQAQIAELQARLEDMLAQAAAENSGNESGEGEDGQRDNSDDDEDQDGQRAHGAALAERRRIQQIRAMATTHRLPDAMSDALINSGASLDAARSTVLSHLAARTAAGPHNVQVVSDERDKFRAAMQDGILLRVGYRFAKDYKPAPGAQSLRGYTMMEMARECLRKAGQQIPDQKMLMLSRAIATTDLPALLVESSRRFLLDGYQYAEETWPLWTDTGSVPDFREGTLIDFAVDTRLHEKKEGEEYKFNKLAEATEKYKIVTYGAKFAITREAIINDDLSALTRIPQSFGVGAKRVVGDAVYGVLIANSTMGDGNPLFDDVNHNNLVTGAGGLPTVENLGQAEVELAMQTDAFGARLNLKPTFYLAPIALRTGSESFFNTTLIGSTINAGQPNITNIYAGAYTRIYEPRLDDDSKKDRYLVASRELGVRVFYLDGVQEPWLETQEGWDTDGMELRVRMDAGVKAVSWRGLQKQTGI